MSLAETVSRITGIGLSTLTERRWSDYSVAQMMSWAAGRQTTRPEDEAYCLMGLFGVNMPMLYGEGRKAFYRLQLEILKQSNDQSLFAWSCPEDQHSHTQMSGLLAPSPEYFKHASEVGLREYGSGEEYENPFELVHQLARLRLRVFRHVEAMCLRRLPSKPAVFDLVDMQSSDGEKRTAATPDLQRNGTLNLENQGPDSPAPVVSVVVEDVGAADEPVGESKESAEVPAAKDASNLEVVGLKEDQAGSELSPRSDEDPTYPEKWHWYIYEPVVVVPLRCQIGSHRLGILLARGIVSRVEGGALSRLHNPSLVAIDTVWDSRSSYIAAYANISIREAAPALRPSELFVPPREWPEVRIAPLLSAGYSIRCFGDPAGGWELNRLAGALGALVPTRNAPWEVDHSRGVLVPADQGRRSQAV
jgi:hypothetical protein